MKKVVSVFLAAVLLTSVCAAFAIEKGESRAVIGADISAEQKAAVYSSFGVEQGAVSELIVTNAEERSYLDGLVDPSIIGTRSISCVYIEILGEGDGLEVSTSNISWCTKDMYINALVTAGIDDAKVIVTSPISGISGTAALTGIYKAYEDITGQQLDEVAKLAGTQELVITAELADEIGSYDAVLIVNELKLILDQTVNMTDDEVRAEIEYVADQYDITVSEGQKDQLVKLCRSLEKLNPEQLKEKVESVQNTLKKLASAKETAANVSESVKKFFDAVSNFFAKLFSKEK
ncbi:MAG: DUF1002 domain-containing protein [Oscillospiraceae bacterium]|nr:DUF1002 domain-containing protein [Oscillospiraceae bacterium]